MTTPKPDSMERERFQLSQEPKAIEQRRKTVELMKQLTLKERHDVLVRVAEKMGRLIR